MSETAGADAYPGGPASSPELPSVELSEQATVRLLPTAYYKVPVLAPLVDDEDDLELLALVEGLTNRRLRAEREGLSDLDPRELAYGAWGTSHVNAAFAYTRPDGNRFNDAGRGAWYCAFDDLTAIAEVAWHRTRELERVGVLEDVAVYQALLAGFIGTFHDARDLPAGTGVLGADADIAYPLGQLLAARLRESGASGIVYPSVRRAGGTCLVAFRPQLVQNVRAGPRWKIVWNGTPDYTVTTD